MSELPEFDGNAAIHESVQNMEDPILRVNNFSAGYGNTKALKDVTMDFERGKITALIGPSGCGKSTLLRSFNRMNDLEESFRSSGEILLNGESIYDPGVDVIELRKRMGMVFQKQNPFPSSIYENAVFPLKIDGETRSKVLTEACERALRGAALWDEVHSKINTPALQLSGGQQQRLCIARAISRQNGAEVLLLDEPCSALDPIATKKIENLLEDLRGEYSIVIVTHNMQQASRASDNTAFFYLGELVEYGTTETIFTNPKLKITEKYVTGHFG